MQNSMFFPFNVYGLSSFSLQVAALRQALGLSKRRDAATEAPEAPLWGSRLGFWGFRVFLGGFRVLGF